MKTTDPNEQTELDKAIAVLKEDMEIARKAENGEFPDAEVVVFVFYDHLRTLLESYEAVARRAAQVEKERDCWVYNANELQKGYNKLDSQLSSANEALKLAVEALTDIDYDLKENMPEYERLESTKVALSHPAIQAILKGE